MKSNPIICWLKYFFIFSSAMLILCMALVAAALLVLDDNDYRKLAIWSVEQVAGYKMIIEGPFAVDVSNELSLSAAGIRFESTFGGTQPYLTSIGQLNVSLALKPLLLG
ncbi:MAG: AsmA family protein [Desulfobacterales bacterium]|nr:MAG: AsmA family protein [Desulfobacterales bacterium]